MGEIAPNHFLMLNIEMLPKITYRNLSQMTVIHDSPNNIFKEEAKVLPF
jgi:hypothetical protein